MTETTIFPRGSSISGIYVASKDTGINLNPVDVSEALKVSLL